MKYRNEIKISNTLFKDSNITKELVIRDFIHKTIKDIPINDLEKLFNIEYIKGSNEELNKARNKEEFYLIKDLIMNYTSLFRLEINL